MQSELQKTRQTVEHMKRNLKSIQAIRAQVKSEDVSKCDEKLDQVQFWIKVEIEQFCQMDDDLSEYLGSGLQEMLKTSWFTIFYIVLVSSLLVCHLLWLFKFFT